MRVTLHLAAAGEHAAYAQLAGRRDCARSAGTMPTWTRPLQIIYAMMCEL
jgi:hypothetical protein